MVYLPSPGGRSDIDFLVYDVTDDNHPDKDESLGIALKGEQWYRRPFKIHRDIGVNKVAVVCPTSIGRRCPVCEYQAELRKKGGDKELIKALRAKDRVLYCVIPIGEHKFEAVPHLFEISHYLFQKLLNEEITEDERYGMFPSPSDGLTVKIRWDSKKIGEGDAFAEANRIDFNSRDYEYDDDMLSKVPDLDSIIHKSVISSEKLSNMFFELETESDAGADDGTEFPPRETSEERPKRERRDATEHTPARKPKGAVPKEKEKESEQESDEDVCIACEGTGINSKGNKCKICNGTGERKNEDKKDTDNACPYDHEFGKDSDVYKDCDDCDREIWGRCLDEKEKNIA